MENDDDKAQHEQKDTIADQNERNLVRRVQEQCELPVVWVFIHVSDDKKDRFWNDRCPCAQKSLAVNESCD